MAIGESSLFKDLKGSFGNLIIYQVGGQTRVRCKGFNFKDAKSAGQVAHRAKVKTIGSLFRELDMQLRIYWKQLTIGTTACGYNLFFKENIKQVGAANKIENFGLFKICKGVLPLPEEIAVAMEAGQKIIMEWDTASDHSQRRSDCLQFAAYQPALAKGPRIQMIESTQVCRKEGHYEFQISDSLERPVYFYAFFKGKYTNDVSDSFFLGGLEAE